MRADSQAILTSIQRADQAYGSSTQGDGQPLQVEFVSANPTGPLTIMHGRGAAVGDAIANLMSCVGYQVQREFYVNDGDAQLERLGRSVEAAYLQLQGIDAVFPEDGYQPEYAMYLAKSILCSDGPCYTALSATERARVLTLLARDRVLMEQRETLERFGVRFDRWFAEHELHDSGGIEAIVERLRTAGCAYDFEGATWLRSRQFGDTEDRTLVRSGGVPTYIAADIAYHLDKFERGFSRVIDVWGADHAGYVSRTRAALLALGIEPSRLEVTVFQPVVLRVDGLRVEGAGRKRLREVIDEVGSETLKFLYLSRPASEPLELDLDVAKRADVRNPWIAAQRAHGLAASLAEGCPDPSGSITSEDSEDDALASQLGRYPDVVKQSAERHDPHGVAAYLSETATKFAEWESTLAPKQPNGANARSINCLADASRIVLRNAMAVLGVRAPERI